MRSDFEKIKVHMNSHKSKDYFQNLRDIWDHKAENDSCNYISGKDCHGNCKADIRDHKKNAYQDGEGIITRIRNGPHTKSAACKNSHDYAADQHDQYICSGDCKHD